MIESHLKPDSLLFNVYYQKNLRLTMKLEDYDIILTTYNLVA